jgi:hypothetical protein
MRAVMAHHLDPLWVIGGQDSDIRIGTNFSRQINHLAIEF